MVTPCLGADSARAQQLADVAAALAVAVGSVRDSVRDVGSRLTSFQGSTRQELYAMGQQLLRLEGLMGQSQTVLRGAMADLEQRNQQIMEQAIRAVTPPVAPGDTTKPQAAVIPLSEGPNTLYQLGVEQFRQRSWSAARDLFTQILTQHPSSDRVPQALKGIADTYDAERDRVRGDSVYSLVVSRFPNADVAPNALYKLARSLEAQKRMGEARTAMQQVVRQYPRSDEAELAAEWLSRNPG